MTLRHRSEKASIDAFGLTIRPDKIENKLKDCLYWAARRSGKRGHPPPELTLRFLLRLWNLQGGRCALTGAPLTCRARSPLGATLDRIDPTKPYTRRNTA